jgi:hypothetical protein
LYTINGQKHTCSTAVVVSFAVASLLNGGNTAATSNANDSLPLNNTSHFATTLPFRTLVLAMTLNRSKLLFTFSRTTIQFEKECIIGAIEQIEEHALQLNGDNVGVGRRIDAQIGHNTRLVDFGWRSQALQQRTTHRHAHIHITTRVCV